MKFNEQKNGLQYILNITPFTIRFRADRIRDLILIIMIESLFPIEFKLYENLIIERELASRADQRVLRWFGNV